MKRHVNLILILITCSIVLLSAAAWQGRAAAKTSWDHKVLVFHAGTTHAEVEKKLVELGYLGWELVQVTPGDSQDTVYYLKRAR